MPDEFAAVPSALRERRQWLVWRFEEKPGAKKPAKMPYYVSGKRRTGVQGDDADRAALTGFEEARAAIAAGHFTGLGFAFLPGDGLIGIDIDGAIDPETGEISERATNIIAACASYTEYSPSRKGVHIIVAGESPTFKSNDIGLEVFCGRQYFTVTGAPFPGSPPEVTPIDAKVLGRLRATVDAAKGKRAASARSAPAAGALPQQVSPPLPGGERERLVGALDAIDPGVGYEPWLHIGMALHASGVADAFALWDAWSARSDKYPGTAVLASHWKSFKPGRVGVGTLYHLAKAAGWKPPRRIRAAKSISPPSPAPAGEEKDADDGGWRFSLWRNDAGNPRAIRENVLVVLTEHPALRGLVAHNVFANRIEKRRKPPWGGQPGEWSRHDTSELADWAANNAGLVMKLRDVSDAVALAAWRQQVNPVRELLEGLPPWDGTERLDYWLIECLGAIDKPYVRLVGRKYLMGMVKRVLEPGCKFDYMLILEGEQGRGKSTTFRILAWSDEWYADTPFSANLDKDARLALHGVWLHEIPEMHGFNKADANAVKVFISQMEDRLRAPYQEQHETFKRTLVFGGTTNESEYFRDRTGNRRFWPVTVRLLDMDRLKDWRAQLFAEALHRVRAGEPIHPSREEENELCAPEQRLRLIADPWQDFIEAWLAEPENRGAKFVSTVDLLRDCLKVDAARIDAYGEMGRRLKSAMDSLGWYPDRGRVNERQQRGYKPRADVVSHNDSVSVYPRNHDDASEKYAF